MSDAHQLTPPQDNWPSASSGLIIVGYDEPNEDSVGRLHNSTMGAAAIITKSQAACHSQADMDKVTQFAAVKDGHGAYEFLAERMAANECVILMLGDTVRIDAFENPSERVCVLPKGQQICFWTPSNGVNLNIDLNRSDPP